jgi:small-conductance mechanosensitive channel
LPTPVGIIRQRAFGDRITSREEEDALNFAASDFAMMKRVEDAQRAVFRRAGAKATSQRMANAWQEAVAEVSGALDAEIVRLRGELTRAKARIGELQEASTHVAAVGRPGTK